MEAAPPSRGLIIAGHGSAKNAGSRAPICAAVQEIRRRGLYDEVRCALWKEEPHFSRILPQMKSDQITIVPYLMSDGYYSRQVIPREMGLTGAVTHQNGKTILLAEAVGSHPLLSSLIIRRAREVGACGKETLVVLGHGTPRNPQSDVNIHLQADRVRDLGIFPEVLAMFIDQEPNLLDLPRFTSARDIILVPLFAAAGWHVRETIPEDLSMQNGQAVLEHCQIRYTEPVGTAPEMIEIVLERAREAEKDFASLRHPT